MIYINADIVVKDFLRFKSVTFLALGLVLEYLEQKGIKLTITSLISDRKGLKTVSNSHEDGRAFDFSIIGLTRAQVELITKELNEAYANLLGAIGKESKLPEFAVLHDAGAGEHIHIQARIGLKLMDIINPLIVNMEKETKSQMPLL